MRCPDRAPRLTVLFDLDGTLTDPKPGITRSIGYALERMNCSAPDPDSLVWCIGPPLRGSFARLLASDDPQTIEKAIALYRERFSDVGLLENELYEGIPEALNTLKQAGLKLFVATSKPRVYADRIIRHFAIDSLLEAVYGSELDGAYDDKGELISHILRCESIDARKCLMVGDRVHDLLGARSNGMGFVGVLCGYGSAEELKDADALCATPNELVAAIQGLLP